jgi:nuclease HARBI1
MLVAATLNATLRDIIPVPAIKFDLWKMRPAKARFRFRFRPDKILTIHAKLRLSDVMFTTQRCPNSSLEALCIVLARLTYPCRWQELVELFGRHHTVLCSVFLDMIDLIYRKVKTRMSFDIAMIECYSPATARAVFERTGGLQNCVEFIDGTVRPACRPKKGQRVAYNGHKRVHAIKFQSIVLANGLIVSLTGPVEGRRHDIALLRMSNVAELMKTNFPQYCVYGDPAYPVKTWIQAPYKGNKLTEVQ